MEAKETVVGIDEYNRVAKQVSERHNATYEEADGLGEELVAELENQAEISFKAGVKEVVEWMASNIFIPQPYAKPIKEALQAKLKEWVIEQ